MAPLCGGGQARLAVTYSIVARDPATGEIGIAVASRYFGAGRMVPWIASGVGAIASQANVRPRYGAEGLARLAAGEAPDVALAAMLAADPDAARRQVAILDAQGRAAGHTGVATLPEAGHAFGTDCVAAANIMARATVWGAMVDAFEAATGPLAERLVAAMGAAEREGGDLRGRQGAGLIVAAPGGDAAEARLGDIDLRVDDHPDAAAELARLLTLRRALTRADQARALANAGDLAGALAGLDAICAVHPDEPEFLTRRALVLLALGQMDEARASLARACAIHPGWAEYVMRLAAPEMTALPFEAVAALAAGLGTTR